MVVSTTAQLKIYWGLPSSSSLGNTGTTDSVPDFLDLYNGDFNIKDESGAALWIPAMPTLKNNGIRADSGMEDGGKLLGAPVGNVIETITLYATANATNLARFYVIKRLDQFIKAARDYGTSEWQSAPVYLAWRAAGAPGEQYALIINMDVSPSKYNPNDPNSVQEITLTIEREPAWRGIPPGDNPKKWTFYKRGLTPTQSASPGATEYNYTHLDLLSAFGGAASYRSLYQQNIYNFDEIATSNVNYIDVDAADIPGDAPALCLITLDCNHSQGAQRSAFARTTRRDYYPSNNNNSTTQRARSTFNGGDATVASPAGLTTTQPIDATYGLLSNGSVVNRYVAQVVTIAGAATLATVATWTRAYAQYANKYRAFCRCVVTGGSASELTMRVSYVPNSGIATPENNQTVTLSGALNNWMTVDLGIVDLTPGQRPLRSADGTGTHTSHTFELRLEVGHAAGVATTLRVTDVILLPIDESTSMIISYDGAMYSPRNNDVIFLDTTGYFQGEPVGMGYRPASTFYKLFEVRGQFLELVPGIDNRIYMMLDYMGVANVTIIQEIRLDIVPRWYGVRDV